MQNWSWPEFAKGLAGELVLVAVFVGLPGWLIIAHKDEIRAWLSAVFG